MEGGGGDSSEAAGGNLGRCGSRGQEQKGALCGEGRRAVLNLDGVHERLGGAGQSRPGQLGALSHRGVVC